MAVNGQTVRMRTFPPKKRLLLGIGVNLSPKTGLRLVLRVFFRTAVPFGGTKDSKIEWICAQKRDCGSKRGFTWNYRRVNLVWNESQFAYEDENTPHPWLVRGVIEPVKNVTNTPTGKTKKNVSMSLWTETEEEPLGFDAVLSPSRRNRVSYTCYSWQR